MLCGDWFISTPPPSVSQRPRQRVPLVVRLVAPHLADDFAHRSCRPSAPLSSAWRMRCAAGNQRRWDIVESSVPCLAGASSTRSASSSVAANGFSTTP